tara:strand:- start:213 stop:419 length:207 start_codon:yes stop_codon:yes gene_type:complete
MSKEKQFKWWENIQKDLQCPRCCNHMIKIKLKTDKNTCFCCGYVVDDEDKQTQESFLWKCGRTPEKNK